MCRRFTDPAPRQSYPQEDLAPQSHSFVADLRAAVGRRSPGDAEATKLLDEWLQQSPEFQALRADQDVEVRRDERKRIVHPTVGMLDLNCLSLFGEDSRQRPLWFTPRAGIDTAEQLTLLTVEVPLKRWTSQADRHRPAPPGRRVTDLPRAPEPHFKDSGPHRIGNQCAHRLSPIHQRANVQVSDAFLRARGNEVACSCWDKEWLQPLC
ncbi:hypothetical protein [Streptomyces sp. NPDC020607]|uniref:MmyB family transcriptional regulator n=1 Tax=Streptomyces sp. NPDC020607 TaxID=3365082 RepID=UPI0037957A1E